MIRKIKKHPKIGDILAFNPQKCPHYPQDSRDKWHMEVIRIIDKKTFVGKCVFSNCHPRVGYQYCYEDFRYYDNLSDTAK